MHVHIILAVGTTMFNNILDLKEKETLSNFIEVNGDSLLLKNTVLPTESYQMLPRYQSKTFCLQGSHNGLNSPSSEERIGSALII